MLDVLPHGGPLPPGYGDYGAAGGRTVVPRGTTMQLSAARPTVAQTAAASGLASQFAAAAGFKKASSTAPLAIPDFDTWNVGAGMIEKVPALKPLDEPWYMNKWLWAAGGVALLGIGYFAFFRNRGGGRFAGFGG